MAGHGGARPNSGRKPRTEVFAKHIRAAEKKIADHLPQIVDNLIELSAGVYVEETDAQGKRKVYQRPPCFKSASYLVDRILGKPTQAIEAEVSGPAGGPIRVSEVVVELPAEEPEESVEEMNRDVDG